MDLDRRENVVALGLHHVGDLVGARRRIAAAIDAIAQLRCSRVNAESLDVLELGKAPAQFLELMGLVKNMAEQVPLADLISVSGMDPFDVLHTLEGLMAAGLVEIDQ